MEGREFGEYTLIMYHYAKQYYRKILRLRLLSLEPLNHTAGENGRKL